MCNFAGSGLTSNHCVTAQALKIQQQQKHPADLTADASFHL